MGNEQSAEPTPNKHDFDVHHKEGSMLEETEFVRDELINLAIRKDRCERVSCLRSSEVFGDPSQMEPEIAAIRDAFYNLERQSTRFIDDTTIGFDVEAAQDGGEYEHGCTFRLVKRASNWSVRVRDCQSEGDYFFCLLHVQVSSANGEKWCATRRCMQAGSLMQQRFLFDGAFPDAKCSVVITIKQCCTEWTLDKVATASRVIDLWKRSGKLAIADVDKAVAAIKGGECQLLQQLLSEKDAELWEALQKLTIAKEPSFVQELVVQEQSVELVELHSQPTAQANAPQVNLCCRDFTRLLQKTIAEKDAVIHDARAEMEQLRVKVIELEKELKNANDARSFDQLNYRVLRKSKEDLENDFNQLVLQVENMREELALKDKQLQTNDIVAHPVVDGHVSFVDAEPVTSDTPEPDRDLIREVYAEREHQLMEDIHCMKKQLAEKNEANEAPTLQLHEAHTVAQGLWLKLAETLEENRLLKAIPRMGAKAMPEESIESDQDDEKASVVSSENSFDRTYDVDSSASSSA